MQEPIPEPTPKVLVPPNYDHRYFQECEAHPLRANRTGLLPPPGQTD
jgi:hypothetical protein